MNNIRRQWSLKNDVNHLYKYGYKNDEQFSRLYLQGNIHLRI